MTYINKYEKLVKESAGKRITRAQAIRLKCLDCCVYQVNEVTQCVSYDCPLYRYRMGHEEKDELYYRQERKPRKPMSEEHKQKLIEGKKIAKINTQEKKKN